MRKKYIPLLLIMLLVLSGCKNSERDVIFDFDGEMKKITSIEPYPDGLFANADGEFIQQLQESNTSLVDIDALQNALVSKKKTGDIPSAQVFGELSEAALESYDGTADWLGERWTMDQFINSSTYITTAGRLRLRFNINDMEYANRRARDITTDFLKTEGDLIFYSNIYEYDILNTYNKPVVLMLDRGDVIVFYSIYMYGVEEDESIPIIDVFFIIKDELHDTSNLVLSETLDTVKQYYRMIGQTLNFRTIILTPNGYLLQEPKNEEDLTPEERLMMGGVFYN